MEQVWNIYKVLVEEDREEHVAVFTDEDKANDAINRLRVRDAELDEVDWNMRPCSTNPTPDMLELPKTLREMGCEELLNAARIELISEGKMYVPLWVNPAWLVHELKAKYDLGIDFRGRQMTLVSASELEARRRHGIPDVNAPSDFGDDAGFVETRD
jgi:hypothetical protein